MDVKPFLPNAGTVAAIEKDIETYNKRRSHAHAEVQRRIPMLMGSLAIGCAAILVLLLANMPSMPPKGIGVVFGLFIGGAIFAGTAIYKFAKQPGEDTRQQFRDHIIPVLFGFVDGIRYSHGYETGTFTRLPALMKGNFNHKEFGDIISGRLNGKRFEISEMTLKRKSKNSDVTVFKGVVLNCGAGHPFKGTLVAIRRPQPGLFQAMDDAFRSLGELFRGERFDTVFSRNRLDNSYEFRTDRRDDVQDLLRGRLSEVLEWINKNWPRGSPRLALRNGEIFVMLPSDKDFFELPAIEVPVIYRADLEPMVKEFAQLLAIVEEIQREPAAEPPQAGAAGPAVEAEAEASVQPAEDEGFVPLLDPVEPPKQP